MSLSAVVFDYGMVLSEPPNPEAQQQLHRITGLSKEELESHYWIDRHAYDRGDLSGLQFWHKLVERAGLKLPPEDVEELNRWDARMWTSVNPAMLEWHKKLKERGLRTGILSNMGDSVMESILEAFAWVQEFDVLIWSYQHRLAKPEAAIYELLLEKLGTRAEETLFLDDKAENIAAARAVGIKGIEFSTVEKLRQELLSEGFDAFLPLP